MDRFLKSNSQMRKRQEQQKPLLKGQRESSRARHHELHGQQRYSSQSYQYPRHSRDSVVHRQEIDTAWDRNLISTIPSSVSTSTIPSSRLSITVPTPSTAASRLVKRSALPNPQTSSAGISSAEPVTLFEVSEANAATLNPSTQQVVSTQDIASTEQVVTTPISPDSTITSPAASSSAITDMRNFFISAPLISDVGALASFKATAPSGALPTEVATFTSSPSSTYEDGGAVSAAAVSTSAPTTFGNSTTIRNDIVATAAGSAKTSSAAGSSISTSAVASTSSSTSLSSSSSSSSTMSPSSSASSATTAAGLVVVGTNAAGSVFTSTQTTLMKSNSPSSNGLSTSSQQGVSTPATANGNTGSAVSPTNTAMTAGSSGIGLGGDSFGSNGNGTSSSTAVPTSTVVGGVVGGVAGLACILLLALVILRWYRRRHVEAIPDGNDDDGGYDAGQMIQTGGSFPNGGRSYGTPGYRSPGFGNEANVGAGAGASAVVGPSANNTPMTMTTTSPGGGSAGAVAGLMKRLSKSRGPPPRTQLPPSPNVTENFNSGGGCRSASGGFQRISGRKLPSAFSPGIEGPGLMRSNGYPGVGGSNSETSPMTQYPSGSDSLVSASYPSGSSHYPSGGTFPSISENPFADPEGGLDSMLYTDDGVVGTGVVGAAGRGIASPTSTRTGGTIPWSISGRSPQETYQPGAARSPEIHTGANRTSTHLLESMSATPKMTTKTSNTTAFATGPFVSSPRAQNEDMRNGAGANSPVITHNTSSPTVHTSLLSQMSRSGSPIEAMDVRGVGRPSVGIASSTSSPTSASASRYVSRPSVTTRKPSVSRFREEGV